MLQNQLQSAIRTKQSGRPSQGVLLLHKNARHHTAAHTMTTLQAPNWNVLKHPAYSTDPAPMDFHLCGPPKGGNERLNIHRLQHDGCRKLLASYTTKDHLF